MNTIKSVYYGWGTLILAGGGAYYFAKRSVNSDRAERAAAEEKRRQQRERMRVTEAMHRDQAMASSNSASVASNTNKTQHGSEAAPNAGHPASEDPAPVSHAQEQMADRGKYEAAEPFRSRKGDRFS